MALIFGVVVTVIALAAVALGQGRVPAGNAVALLRAGHAFVEALAVLLQAGRLAALAPGLVHHHGVLLLII